MIELEEKKDDNLTLSVKQFCAISKMHNESLLNSFSSESINNMALSFLIIHDYLSLNGFHMVNGFTKLESMLLFIEKQKRKEE